MKLEGEKGCHHAADPLGPPCLYQQVGSATVDDEIRLGRALY